MTDQTQDAGIVNLTEPVTLTFPNLLEAKSVVLNGKATGDPKFSSNFEFDTSSADLATLKAKAVEVARAKWPGIDLKDLDFPFTSGDKLADKAAAKGKDREWSRGKVVMTSRSKYEPRLAILEGNKLVDYDGERRALAKPAFYTGVQVLAQFNLVAYDAVGNGRPGVTAYLNQVVSLKRGDKLAGGASAAETFKGYVGIVSPVDPTAQPVGADEIPF